MTTLESNAPLIPTIDLLARHAETDAQAERNIRALLANSPWMRDLDAHVMAISRQQGAARARLNRMLELADRIAAATAPHAACRVGCSHCCHVAVVISQREADLIGVAVGRKPKKVRGITPAEEQALKTEKFGEPCPFLKHGECSIYAVRPIACRVHFNLADTPYFCDTAIQPSQSRVPNTDLRTFWAAYSVLMLDTPLADIRAFFPQKNAGK